MAVGTHSLVAQDPLEWENFDGGLWEDTQQNLMEDSCNVSFVFTHSPLRFDQNALIEFQFQHIDQLSTLKLQRSNGLGPQISPTSIIGNRVVFDHLLLNETYVLKGVGYCGQVQELVKVSTAAPANPTDVAIISEQLFEAILDYHEQDAATFKDIVHFLLDYPGLSRNEVLSYIQVFLRKGESVDRTILNPSVQVSFNNFSLLSRNPGDGVDPDPNDPDPIRTDSTYCHCRIVQTMTNIAVPGSRSDDNQFTYLPETLVNDTIRTVTLLTSHQRQHFLRTIGPAKVARNFATGIHQLDRKNLQVSTIDTVHRRPLSSLHAQLRYTLNCTDNRGSNAVIELCDCEREGKLNWSYDVAFRTNGNVTFDPLFPSYAEGFIMDMAYVVKIENDRDPVVLDVGMADVGVACNASISQDQRNRLLLIRESMGLAVLQNLTRSSDSTAFQFNWSNIASNILDQIRTILNDTSFVNQCSGASTINRRLLDSDFVGNRSTFKLRMGKEVKIIMASGVHSNINLKGHAGISLSSNSAFRLAGWINGGNAIDITNPDDPRNKNTCCGKYTGNYVLASIDHSEIAPPITELNLRRLLGEFYTGGFWESLGDGTIIPNDPGEGIVLLPPGNFFQMISRPEFSPFCIIPIIIPRSARENRFNPESALSDTIHSWETYLNAIEQGSLNQGRLTIYSMDGKFIHQVQDIRVETVRHAVQQQPSGMYLLQHQTPNQMITFKMIKL